jgi:hypothetical protein
MSLVLIVYGRLIENSEITLLSVCHRAHLYASGKLMNLWV